MAVNFSVAAWLNKYQGEFESISQTPLLDAQLIFCFCTGWSRAQLLLNNNKIIPKKTLIFTQLQLFVRLRSQGYPIAYLIGKKDFGSLSFHVCPGILIPRSETECFIDIFLETYSTLASLSIRDVGTGSGCLALSLAYHFPNSHITANDISRTSQRLFLKNQQILKINNVSFLLNPFLKGGEQFYDIIIANLPYLTPKETSDKKHKEFWKEPSLALNGGSKDGLQLIKKLIKKSKKSCKCIYLEADPLQMSILKKELIKNQFTKIKIYQDLSGRNRIIQGIQLDYADQYI